MGGPERADNFTVVVSRTPDFGHFEYADDQIFGSMVFVNNFEPNTTYYWHVRGKNEGGLGPWSETWSYTTETEGAVDDEPTASLSLRCHPNPIVSVGQIQFNLQRPEKVTMRLVNLLGSQIALLAEGSFGVGTHSIEWHPAVEAGLYFVELRTQEFAKILPVIVK